MYVFISSHFLVDKFRLISWGIFDLNGALCCIAPYLCASSYLSAGWIPTLAFHRVGSSLAAENTSNRFDNSLSLSLNCEESRLKWIFNPKSDTTIHLHVIGILVKKIRGRPVWFTENWWQDPVAHVPLLHVLSVWKTYLARMQSRTTESPFKQSNCIDWPNSFVIILCEIVIVTEPDVERYPVTAPLHRWWQWEESRDWILWFLGDRTTILQTV